MKIFLFLAGLVAGMWISLIVVKNSDIVPPDGVIIADNFIVGSLFSINGHVWTAREYVLIDHGMRIQNDTVFAENFIISGKFNARKPIQRFVGTVISRNK